ncbi:Acetyltransferase (isoleucine patch superfamily)-like protein [Shewanella sediminis HAW-EB3]|uniref:Acetyltransferase (Isoleucine patch superfamily)-like protein n=1 Tax=Shewanella sediminis (strain HAW-EB3) TaxID=425104 RepID=A8FXK2_SHESH|nr:acyltransferase [Shewanella sediminis]ABV37575.1 Acetyltransferase (isoleucine patch superfamily)-like protein [Shewanella sediminis HAW-EB3]
MKSLIKRLITSNQYLNDRVFNYGFLTKFNLRQYFFNCLINFLSGKKQGKYSYAHFTSQVIAADNLKLTGTKKGTYCSLVVSGGCYLQAGNGITIGEGTIWAPNVAIISANHDMNQKDNAWSKDDGVVIGKECWIGTGATILPGVTIGDNCIIAAGAVVTRSFKESNQVIGGVPAKVIR